MSHIILRPTAVMLGAFAVWRLDRQAFGRVRVVTAGLVALAGLMLVQLIPLPPFLWTALPGRETAQAGAQILGIDQPWRPISLSPARTWNSLVSLFPPLCAVLLLAGAPAYRRPLLVTVLVCLIGASAVLGIAQRAGPENGLLYLYRITNNGSAVGFFANRNHQAAILAAMVPMLAVFASLGAIRRKRNSHRKWIAIGAGLGLVPLLLATGSRAGLVLFALAIVASLPLLRVPGVANATSRGSVRRVAILLVAAAIGLAMVTYLVAQAEAVSRFSDGSLGEDLRVRLFPTFLVMAGDGFPVGFGFGAFEPVFRAYEPVAGMGSAYVNNAHNDLAQLVIEGGLPAVALLLAFLVWFFIKSAAVWRRQEGEPTQIMLGRLGSVTIALLLLASLTDYPLRVPFIMTIFALAAAWLELSRREA